MDGSLFFAENSTQNYKLTEEHKTFRLLGFDFVKGSASNIAMSLVTSVRSGKRQHITFVDTCSLNKAIKDKKYRTALNAAHALIPVGAGVQAASKLFGQRIDNALNATDMVMSICKEAAKASMPVYFLGMERKYVDETVRKVTADIPNLAIAGYHGACSSDHEEEQIINNINKSGAGILFVAQGGALDENWLATNQDRLYPPVTIGVGQSFDFLSGKLPQASKFLRVFGLEKVSNRLSGLFQLSSQHTWETSEFIGRAIHDAAGRYYKAFAKALSAAGKRMLDILGAGTGLLILSPLFLTLAASIKLDSRGPVLFSQTRIGKNGKPFEIFKFRSMTTDAEALKTGLQEQNERGTDTSFKMKDDPRITRVGRFLRRLSLDELPQLITILRGDMSIVGPRPPLPNEVENYDERAMRRLDGKPGLTCIWQVSGRADVSFEEQVEMDINYLQEQSLILDLKLIILTVPAVISGRGAY